MESHDEAAFLPYYLTFFQMFSTSFSKRVTVGNATEFRHEWISYLVIDNSARSHTQHHPRHTQPPSTPSPSHPAHPLLSTAHRRPPPTTSPLTPYDSAHNPFPISWFTSLLMAPSAARGTPVSLAAWSTPDTRIIGVSDTSASQALRWSNAEMGLLKGRDGGGG